MFIKRIKQLHSQNSKTQHNQRLLETVVVKYSVVGITQYVSTLMVLLLNIISLLLPVGLNIPRFIFEISWNICFYTDIIINITCLYFQYNIGKKDYYRCCGYCDNTCFKRNFHTTKLNNTPSMSKTVTKRNRSPSEAVAMESISPTSTDGTRTPSVKSP